MDEKNLIAIITAVIAAMAAFGSIIISVYSARSIRELEEKYAQRRESAEFIAERLNNLYVPLRMHLACTKRLFKRYFEEKTSDEEKTAIEHELRLHNTEVRDRLMKWSVYIEPESGADLQRDPDELVLNLLEHLIQWETVYKLKYEYKVYDGPVFAGIEKFGFRGFPDGVDKYFAQTEVMLRKRMHDRLRETRQ